MVYRKTVTIRDIAQAAGVSPTLVSFVLSNEASGTKKYKVSEQTAQRVLEISRQYDFHPSEVARTLSCGKSHTIGVLIPDIANPFFSELARYLENKASSMGYSILFSSTDEDNDKMSRLASIYVDKGVDGLVVVPNDESADALKPFISTGKPIVLIDRDIDGAQLDCVSLNNSAAAHNLTRALLDQGCRKPEMISYSFRASSIVAREQGYTEAMKEAGFTESIHIEKYHHNDFGELAGYIKEAKARGVDGFLVAANTLTREAICALLNAGYAVPGDFKLATFDTNGLLNIPSLKLVAADQPIEEFADRAIECLIGRIEETIDQPSGLKLLFEPRLKYS